MLKVIIQKDALYDFYSPEKKYVLEPSENFSRILYNMSYSQYTYKRSFFGLYFASVIGTKVFPNEPVPPVIKIVEFVSIDFLPSLIKN